MLSSVASAGPASSWEVPGVAKALSIVADSGNDPVGAFFTDEDGASTPHGLSRRVALKGRVRIGPANVAEWWSLFASPPKALATRDPFGRRVAIGGPKGRGCGGWSSGLRGVCHGICPTSDVCALCFESSGFFVHGVSVSLRDDAFGLRPEVLIVPRWLSLPNRTSSRAKKHVIFSSFVKGARGHIASEPLLVVEVFPSGEDFGVI